LFREKGFEEVGELLFEKPWQDAYVFEFRSASPCIPDGPPGPYFNLLSLLRKSPQHLGFPSTKDGEGLGFNVRGAFFL